MTETRSRNPFAVRDFRLLWAGEAVSVLGDQFALVVLTWLALVLTGSALALGAGGQVSLDTMLVVAGPGMAMLCFVALLFPTVRRIGLVPPYEAPDGDGEAGRPGATAEPAPA